MQTYVYSSAILDTAEKEYYFNLFIDEWLLKVDISNYFICVLIMCLICICLIIIMD